MGDHSPTPASGATPSPHDRLDSWKEIAAYLGRGIRTVQRWERQEGLPVHRLPHEKRGSVYARREELAEWWERRRLVLADAPATADAPAPAPHVERVTRTSAATFWPALSSDGRMIAYTSDTGQEGLAPQIWIQQIGGGSFRLTNGQREYSNLSFAPGDTRIVFTAVDESGQNVYEIPTLGGESRLLKRAASRARYSPDGRWLAFVSLDSRGGVQVVARDGTGSKTIAPDLLDVACTVWSPDSRYVLIHAHPAPELEADWWVVPIDDGPPSNTGIIRKLREEGFFAGPTSAAWVDEWLVYSATASEEFHLYRQRMVPPTFQAVGSRQQLTVGHESESYTAAAGGRLAYVSSHRDANLWSIAIDPASGVAHGPLRRMTRGPGLAAHLSTTKDGLTLVYFSTRLGSGDVFFKELVTGAETITASPPGGRGYPAISPLGDQLAYGTRVPGDRAMRPIFIENLRDGTSRTLGDDCGGRPRQWVDERWLVIERFARLNAIALIDTVTGEQRELLRSAERSVKNPRVSPDRRWIAFDAARPGDLASVMLAPLEDTSEIPESGWVVAACAASNPFWSADGRLLYYLPTGGHAPVRSLVVRARQVFPESGLQGGEPIAVYASLEMMMPAYPPGATPVATADQIIFVLGNFRGDVWLMELEPRHASGKGE
jgi:Tol biopolymer transport system component